MRSREERTRTYQHYKDAGYTFVRKAQQWGVEDGSDEAYYTVVYYYGIYYNLLEMPMTQWVDFEWDKINENHIVDDHGVDPYEAEEAVRDDPNVVPFPAQNGRLGYIGRTDGRRLLVVILERKAVDLVRVITAYDASSRERKIYRRRNR